MTDAAALLAEIAVIAARAVAVEPAQTVHVFPSPCPCGKCRRLVLGNHRRALVVDLTPQAARALAARLAPASRIVPSWN